MPSDNGETIAQRIERGREQNSIGDGAIVPFPGDPNLDYLFAMLSTFENGWIVQQQNGGYQLSGATYHSEQGDPIFITLRLDHPDYCADRPNELKKHIRPLRCERVLGAFGKSSLRHIEGARPLYNLDKLAARPIDRVLLVEGERTADAAQAHFPDYVATTWPGGALSVGKVELLPLIGRNVTIWPDHDEDGRKGASRLAERLLREAVGSCRIVQVPADFPNKWDLADA